MEISFFKIYPAITFFGINVNLNFRLSFSPNFFVSFVKVVSLAMTLLLPIATHLPKYSFPNFIMFVNTFRLDYELGFFVGQQKSVDGILTTGEWKFNYFQN